MKRPTTRPFTNIVSNDRSKRHWKWHMGPSCELRTRSRGVCVCVSGVNPTAHYYNNNLLLYCSKGYMQTMRREGGRAQITSTNSYVTNKRWFSYSTWSMGRTCWQRHMILAFIKTDRRQEEPHQGPNLPNNIPNEPLVFITLLCI